MRIMNMMIKLIIQVPPASARVAVRDVMLTRHFLSPHTTANLLHIKENISLIWWNISFWWGISWMLTRHFLSRRTTANCCQLLLHIKEKISLVKFDIFLIIWKISAIISNIYLIRLSFSLMNLTLSLRSPRSRTVSKFILKHWHLNSNFQYTWDVESHSYGFPS